LTTEYSRLYIGVTVTQGEVRKIEELPSPVTPEDRGEHAPENKTFFAKRTQEVGDTPFDDARVHWG